MENNYCAIILLNFNAWEDTIECLESVFKLEDVNYKVFVVDNSINDESVNKIKSWAEGNQEVKNSKINSLVYPLEKKPIPYRLFYEEDDIEDNDTSLILIRANQNKGFAAGNNIALKHIVNSSLYKFVWLLNNDTVVKKDALSELVKATTPVMGIVGSVLVYYHKPELIQGVGGRLNKWFGTSKPILNGKFLSSLNENEKIDYPIGASMLVTKLFLEQVGLMEESYFLYYEELDWVIRGKKKGFNTKYAKNSIVYHKVGASIGTGKALVRSEFSDYYTLKNRLKFTKKYYFRYLPFTYIGFLIVIFNRLKRGQIKYAKNAIMIMFDRPISKFKKI
ncbi:glycosyltransferase family 2 protein [Formosa algae]|uniref:GT2 family glycosyltransferase n=1 Tax=Formosa algae TaxID=225843 RepID=A0A9X0YK82_9FLAO|nr:glycosyltransferase family 2 protein [Formosa algae]MBP1838709.1 GT2 family glycosyltransferase [Formosa algae]MDQ0335209.1 GT2 family glycosyltransferase [Formosa algae]OEI81643.1 hypothetical protein AST99_02890 [Formosa algae]